MKNFFRILKLFPLNLPKLVNPSLARIFLIALAALTLASGCRGASAPDGAEAEKNSETGSQAETKALTQPAAKKTHVVIDSIGRAVTLPDPVTRAVIANGYNLELTNAIGAIDAIIGVDYITFSDLDAYGTHFTEDVVIGQSTSELNYEKIIELAPEVLIITGNGTWEDAEKKLGPFGIKVFVLNAYYTGEFRENWAIAGRLFGKEKEAEELIAYFDGIINYINTSLAGVPKKTLYYEYKRIGNSTIPGDYFHNMVVYAGAQNIFDDAKNVEIDPEAVILRNPDYIVRVGTSNVNGRYIPPTPEEFQRRKDDVTSRPGWDEISAVKNDRILLLSHYSQGAASKLVGMTYIAKFLYPELLPDLNPEEVFKTWLEKYQKLPYIEGHTVPAFSLNKTESSDSAESAQSADNAQSPESAQSPDNAQSPENAQSPDNAQSPANAETPENTDSPA
jgi:iron complex transport system substrate-binding protein